MKFAELKKHLRENKLAPCYLVYGEDGYLVRSAEKQFSALAGEFSELNLSILDETATARQIIEAAESLPFGERRVCIVRGAKQIDKLSDYLKNPCATTVLVFIGDAKSLKNGIVGVDCSRLDKKDVVKYIALESDKYNCKITYEAAELLADYCSGYMGRIFSETQKLAALNTGGTIVSDAVAKYVSPELEYRVFDLTDAIIGRRTKKALTLLDDMLSKGVGEAAKTFGLIYSQFRRMLYVSLSGEAAASSLELKGYAYNATQKQAAQFKQIRLKQLVDELHELDHACKTGSVSYKTGLQCFIIKASSEER